MPGPKDAETMLAKAHEDLEALRAMCAIPRISNEIFGFHAQQAIEKSFKAWIASTGHEYPKVHNLIALLLLLEGYGYDMQRFSSLVKYDAFAVQFRYMQVQELDAELDRDETVREVAEVVEHVENLMGGSGAPESER